jgi:hypothetical protein
VLAGICAGSKACNKGPERSCIEFVGPEKTRRRNLGRRTRLDLGIIGDVKATLRALVPLSPLAAGMPATPAPEVQPEDHRNALDRNALQKTPVLAMPKRKRTTGPASAPKLRQNRFKYSATKTAGTLRSLSSESEGDHFPRLHFRE